ncbi:MAG: DUF2085 domain-containing protein [Coriobacteriia bacterium]|nr:DUF2085 domain-containing protein [Coriobacteriia bacterium]
MNLYKEILHLLGFGLCHQMPERSFIYGGVQLPVCARCTGMYVGITITLVLLFVLYKGAQRVGLPSTAFFVAAAIATFAIGFDGFGSYLGFYETNNFARILTGIMFGSAMGVVLYAILIESLAKFISADKILNTTKEMSIWLASVPLGLLFIYIICPLLGPLAAGLVGILIIVTFWLLALVIVGLLPRYRQSVESWRDLIEPLIWALPIACAIIILCIGLQLWAMEVML